jgi:Na+:H+ antiporter, NhaA family
VSAEGTVPPPTRPGPAPRISMFRPYRSQRLRQFLANEAGSAALLLAAAVVALV